MTGRLLVLVGPELVLGAAALVVLLWDAWGTGADLESAAPRPGPTWVSLLAIAAALVWNAAAGSPGAGFAGTYLRDGITPLLDVAALGAAGLAVLLSKAYLRRVRLPAGEFHALVLLSTVGAMLMAGSGSLLTLFLGLELLSVPLYVLAGLARRSVWSQEAGLKYLLIGAFATAFFVYGIALVYGATGSLLFTQVAKAPRSPLLGAGVALVTIGLGFEAALVPFHAWAPDVYEGAPLPATAFMSVIAKIGAFAGLLRVFPLGLPHLGDLWGPALAALAIASMLLGNLAALFQTNLKRLLAYSGIAHAGYLLIGVASGGADGVSGVLYYLSVYAGMNLGVFGVLALLERRGAEAVDLSDLRGLIGRAPWAAVLLAVFMVSLAGLPPTAGFIAKLYVFRAALAAHQTGLALAGVLTSVVSVFYYLRVAHAALSGEAQVSLRVARSGFLGAALAVALAGVLWLGILPGGFTAAVEQAAAVVR